MWGIAMDSGVHGKQTKFIYFSGAMFTSSMHSRYVRFLPQGLKARLLVISGSELFMIPSIRYLTTKKSFTIREIGKGGILAFSNSWS